MGPVKIIRQLTMCDVWLQPEGLKLRQRRPRGERWTPSHARSIPYQRASYNGHTHSFIHLHSHFLRTFLYSLPLSGFVYLLPSCFSGIFFKKQYSLLIGHSVRYIANFFNVYVINFLLVYLNWWDIVHQFILNSN